MNVLERIKGTTAGLWSRFIHASLWLKIVIVLVVGAIGWYFISSTFLNTSNKPQYQTAQAEKGTLIVAVSASGTVSTANSSSVTTQSSGVVSKLYAQNGQTVKAGDPIAELDLDRASQQNYTQALASYQSAQNTLASAKAQQLSLQAAMFTNWEAFQNFTNDSTYSDVNSPARALPDFNIAQQNWLSAEQQYKNQQNVIGQAQTSASSAWYSLQQSSPTIYAPISGTVNGLSLQVGSVIGGSSSSSSSTTSTTGSSNSSSNSSSQKIATILTVANPTVTVNLAEIDAPNVKVGNKATITLDALADKTFTGKVVSVDTVGAVSSGVTTYPTVIQMDTPNPDIFTNMSASANIITATKDDVLLVPSSAIQTTNGETTVRTLKNGQLQSIPVEIGLASDTQTEIISGLAEGTTVVTAVTTPTRSTTSTTTTSPFSSGLGGIRTGGGGAGQNRTGR